MAELNQVGHLLEHRYTKFLQWVEPRPSRRLDGVEFNQSVQVLVSATVHDCISMARYVCKDVPEIPDDKKLLLDFMAIHWAQVVDQQHAE